MTRIQNPSHPADPCSPTFQNPSHPADPCSPTFELALTGTSSPRQYTAFVPGGDGAPAAEHTFDWRTDSTALAQDLGALAHAAIEGHPPENDLHLTFGRHLFDTVFAGPVRDLWQERLAQLRPRRQPLRLVLRIDPATARPLLNLPWEYLHDGHDFLALNWRTPLSRLPWGLPATSLPPLEEPLRLLVLIAAPLGLSQNQVLNTAREEDLILEALRQAHRAGRIEVAFTPNGAPETLERWLCEFDPHVLHFVGHGVFVEARDTGLLLMETPDGHQRRVENAEFVRRIERQARSLRLVFLSACQSAVAPRTDGFADLAPRLLEVGIPAVVAMQYSVLNRSAMDLGSAFYKGLADGDAVDAALTEARSRLAGEGLNTVDFATPVLFLSDPGCLQVDRAAVAAAPVSTPLDLTGLVPAQQFVGRQAELRELQTALDPQGGRWRAAVIHGLGGMGKTVLAARLAQRMAPLLDGVKALRMAPTTRAQDVLDQVAGFLLVGNARWNQPLIPPFVRLKDERLPLETKAAALIEILRSLRLLLIFDNYEDVLPEGRAVSRASSGPPPGEETEPQGGTETGVDPDLPKLVALLVAGVAGPSRFLFTSRVDFDPLEVGRLGGAVGHLGLGEMQFRDAVYLMETLPPLDALPVAAMQEVRPDRPPAPKALSMRDLYRRLGGHPYTLTLFAEHARRSSVQAVLDDLAGVRQELLAFTLLERATAELPERARELLLRAAVYEEPVPEEGLAFLMGDETDAMPPVGEDVRALEAWGLLARPPGEDTCVVHTPVRDWAREVMGETEAAQEQRLALLRRAARFWRVTATESGDSGAYLRARHYLFLAGDYEEAGEIVQAGFEYLLRWGQIELLLRLLGESTRTLSGGGRAIALGNLATVYKGLGEYAAARRIYRQVLAEFEALGDRRDVAVALHQLGMLDQAQGEYGRARERYEQALAIEEELGNRAGVARSLHQLGTLHQAQGKYAAAHRIYQQVLTTFQELGDRANVAGSLHQLGALHQDQGEYERARERYEQALAIEQELGDRDGVSRSLHQLGMLHQLQGEYGRARKRYEQALAIAEKLGDRAGVARSLHNLGALHQAQGEYGRARERYEQALAIAEELGDLDGIATSLGQLGNLHYSQGEYGRARERYEQALAIAEKLGDRAGLAGSQHNLGALHQAQGDYGRAREHYERALATFQELGNRAGVASSLHQLGKLHQAQGEYGRARERYEKALATFRELGDRDGVASSLHNLGALYQAQGEYGRARERYEQALAIEEELGDRAGVARSLQNLGALHQAQGEYERARERYEQALAIAEELGDRAGVARSLHGLGTLHQAQGQYGRARERYEQALAIAEELGDRAGVARNLYQLGILHQLQGEYGRARERYERSLTIAEELGDRAGVARSLHVLGTLHQAQGEYGQARERCEQALVTFQELGDCAGMASSLAQMGVLSEQEVDLAQAAALLAQALALFERLGAPERRQARRDLARLRGKMGEQAFQAALQEAATAPPAGPGDAAAGPGMTLEQAAELVVNNTVAALTQAPERREAWWQALGQLQQQARSQGQPQEWADFATFLGLLRQLLEGADPTALTPRVPPPFRPRWDALLRAISEPGEG